MSDSKELLNYAKSYNKSIRTLSRIYLSKFRGSFEEEEAFRTKKRLDVIISEKPLFVIKETGPHILKYANVIQSRDWDKILTFKLDNEQKSKNSSEAYKIDNKISFIQKVLKSSSVQEHSTIMDILEDMLSSYCQFAMFIKKNNITNM